MYTALNIISKNSGRNSSVNDPLKINITSCPKISFQWLSDVRDKVALNDAGEIPIILLANKWDIGENCLSNEAISKFATQNGFKAWFNTSAKTNLNIGNLIYIN